MWRYNAVPECCRPYTAIVVSEVLRQPVHQRERQQHGKEMQRRQQRGQEGVEEQGGRGAGQEGQGGDVLSA